MYRFYSTLNAKEGYIPVGDISGPRHTGCPIAEIETVDCSVGRAQIARIFAPHETAFVDLMGVTYYYAVFADPVCSYLLDTGR